MNRLEHLTVFPILITNDSPMTSLIISSFMSMISDCFSNSIMIFWISGSFICLFMLVMALVTPFMAWDMALWLFRVWIFSETA